jgi:hypothetical protein
MAKPDMALTDPNHLFHAPWADKGSNHAVARPRQVPNAFPFKLVAVLSIGL